LVSGPLTPKKCHFDTVNANFANAPAQVARNCVLGFLTGKKSLPAGTLRFVHEVPDSARH
jgi:hypothetical protein